MNPRHLGKYELVERLGWDTSGKIWKAFDTQLHRFVAIKIIEVNLETSGEFFPRFNQEGKAVAALRHPNIIQVQDFFIAQDHNEAYIVMDYVEGQSLADYLNVTARTGKLSSPAEIVGLLIPLAAALDYAHQQGVLHGALNPNNILLDRRRSTSSTPGEPILIDFGMHQRQDLRLLPLNEVSYVAPEMAQGYIGTSRSDLYSLGVIIYELCTGALPFQGETSSDVLMQHIHSAPTSPALINPHIRPALTGVIMRSLSRDPAARFSTATALVTAVAKAMNISVPESMSQSNPALNITNPPSSSDISDPNSPTYLSFQRSSPSAPLPPMGASSGVPPFPSSPGMPYMTPVLYPGTPTGSFQNMQPNVTPVPSQVSGPHPVISSSGPMPVVPPALQPSRQAQHPLAPLSTFATSTKKRRMGLLTALAVLLVIVLLGSGLLLYLSLTSASTPSQTIKGHAFFVSSGLINTQSNQGITDELRVSLQNIGDPQSGKRYYGWLMSNAGADAPPIALGPLSVDHRQITATYVDPNHNNLLANYGRFLVTEEDASQQPANPSLDVQVWRYYSAFSTAANPADPKHYSLLDHMRHLLSQDPKLKGVGLRGGLSEWLFRNTTKILETAGSARDTRKACPEGVPETCDTGLILRQVARILDYLDGAAYVQTENIPTSIQGDHLLIDPTVARVALLEFDTLNQQPPGYLEHIGTHLRDISQISSATPNQRDLANRINLDINNVQGWLDALHADAQKIIHMSPTQLVQPEALTTLNDLFTQANTALVGQIDPNTDKVKDGVVQIYYNIQALATFDVAPCTINNGHSSCAEGGNG
jgi:eukaryotic-like serine/threonine-protein kinase